ncbi:ABC transporter permease [Chitinimonas lacunae]|uniref:Transport permease protein n=1 Tax=Chitinimonas lacunae TaxID=1963018 RepID=A0ABV8MXU3_9NEIS
MQARLQRWYGLRFLVGQLALREVAQRYRGSWLGGLWAILTPLLMLGVYTWVFSSVFQARWSEGSGGSEADFALNVFAGMLFLQFFSDNVARAPGLVTSNGNYVKKVVFPLAILPCVSLLSSLTHFLIGLAIWGTFYFYVHQTLHATLLYLPLVMLPLLLLTLGLSWFLAATGAYVRDIGQGVQMLMTLLTFVSPVFYPLDRLPESMRGWLLFNPLSFPIEQGRAVMIQGLTPDWAGLGIYALVGLVAVVIGYRWFNFTRPGFADVL